MAFSHMSSDESITVVVDGKTTTVKSDTPNFKPLKAALRANDEEAVRKSLSVSGAVEAWSQGNFKLDGNRALYKDVPISGELGERIVQMAANGESPEPLVKFWEKLQRNPSWRSVEQLFSFLKHQGIPIIANGNFLAYKGVKSNYTDKHSGLVDNKPGAVCEMPRNKISDDPNEACHYGFHVGALSYARNFANTVVVCEVDPADVVCIPYDSSQEKMRVCRYRVRGNHSGELLPSTTYDLEQDLGTGAEIEQEQEELDLDIEEIPDAASEVLVKALETLDEANATFERTVSMIQVLDDEVVADTSAKVAEAKAKAVKVQITKKPPMEKRLKKQRAAGKKPVLKVSKEFKRVHEMDSRALLDVGIMDLRDYAGKVLHIVGASKIPGGKVPLVNLILKTRKQFA